MNTLCGCGKSGRYMIKDADGFDVYSCNKYQRCPTYDELYEINRKFIIEARDCKKKLSMIQQAERIKNGLD